MDLSSIDLYISQFANLNTKITNGYKQPNKAILLLSLMELVRCDFIKGNRILLEDPIKIAFDYTWRLYFDSEAPNVWTPFWHLKSEPFWHFQPIYSKADVESLAPPGQTASIGKMIKSIEYAFFDIELFSLIQNKDGRGQLTDVLLKTYIKEWGG